MRYAIVVEKGPTSYGAYVPDLPGCVAAAETRDEVVQLIREAIERYIHDHLQDDIDRQIVAGYRRMPQEPDPRSEARATPRARPPA